VPYRGGDAGKHWVGLCLGIVAKGNSVLPSNSDWFRSYTGDSGSTVVKALCYKSEGRWFDSLKVTYGALGNSSESGLCPIL